MNYNQNSGYGSALLHSIQSIVPTFGNIFVVCSSSDSADPNYEKLQQIMPVDVEGRIRFFTSVKEAYDATTTNNNDVILLDAHTTHTLTAMLTVSKNRVHFIGMDGCNRKYGQRAKINIGVTTATTDIALIKNTGVGNSFVNIKFMSDNTLAQALSVFAEGGEYTYFKNCEFYRSTLLDGATSCELLLNGDSPEFVDCTFGSLADLIVGDVIHPCVRLANGQVGSGLVTRDAYFKGCNFWRRSGGTTTAMVYLASDNDLERLMEFEDCKFVNAKNSTAVPAVAISSAASLTKSHIILTGNTVAVNCTKVGTATGIMSCTPARVATATIAIQGT